MQETKDLFAFIEKSPTPWHAVQTTAARLEEAGYTRLEEAQPWALVPGQKYYTVRAGSSLIAWRMPLAAGAGWRMAAAHSDSPAFKVKGASVHAGCTMLDTEGYGGMIRASWLDRPLGLAGRVMVKTPEGIESRLVAPDGDLAVIPHLAIHMDRAMNEGHKYDVKKDMQALFAPGEAPESYRALLASEAGCAPEELLAEDILLYCRQPGRAVGPGGQLLLCPRLDDLGCAWAALEGFLAGEADCSQGAVFCLFDNEEVGSGTRQGACSSFLPDILARAGAALGESGETRRQGLAKSLLLSADNAHATHPNFAEMGDAAHPVRLNSGVVLKFNASQKYTTTAATAALFRAVCAAAGVPVQEYYNRPDLPGGSTLGNLLAAQVSVPMADVGLPQLAMHSAVETAGAQDASWLKTACAAWYSARLSPKGEGWVFRP